MCADPSGPKDPASPTAARESEERLRADDGAPLRLFVATPANGLAPGAVLLIHDIWGFTEFYKDLARRLAGWGFGAALVDLFARQGELPEAMRAPERGPLGPDARAAAAARAERLADERALADIDGTVDRLRAMGAPQVAAWGFCWGGRLAYRAAARSRRIAAAVAYYGFLRAQPPRLSPLDLVAEIQVPVLGIFGGADPGIPPEEVAAFESALTSEGKEHEIVVYPGAPHGFLRYGARDHAGAIQDAERRTRRFFEGCLARPLRVR